MPNSQYVTDKSIDLEYIANMSGHKWDEVTFKINSPDGCRIAIKAEGQRVCFHIYLKDADSVDSARAIADPLIQHQADFLAFHYKTGISDPVFTTGVMVPEVRADGSFNHFVTMNTHIGLQARISAPASSTPPTVTEFENRNHPGQKYLSSFRQALASSDPVDNFISLYRILEEIFKKQNDIDRAIIRLEPNVSVKTSMDRNAKTKSETVYMRLRNDFCHQRVNSSAGSLTEQTRTGIRDNLPKFIEVVKKAIAEQP